MKLFSSVSLLILSQLFISCGSPSINAEMDKADKIVTNQAAPLTLKAKLMAREGSTIRTPAALSSSEIDANNDANYDLISSVTGYKAAGKLKTHDVSYDLGILSIAIGPDLNPQALALIVNGGSYDSMAFALPVHAIEVKKVTIKKNVVKAKIYQRSETDKSPFYKDSPLCFSVKLTEKEIDHQVTISRKANFTIGDCKEF